MVMTVDKLNDAMRKVYGATPTPGAMPGAALGAMRVVFDANALADTDVRNFPPSKNRSKRIEKETGEAVWRRLPQGACDLPGARHDHRAPEIQAGVGAC